MSKIKFRKQYKPAGFGDRPSGQTVEGIAAFKAAETRRFNRMAEGEQGGGGSRTRMDSANDQILRMVPESHEVQGFAPIGSEMAA
jgi:hypothetical protein